MSKLKDRLSGIFPKLRDEVRAAAKEHGDLPCGQVTLSQILGGMRGIRGMLCDTSLVTANEGLFIRDIHISKLTDCLPEEVFYLMLVGELPKADELVDLQADLKKNSRVPVYIWNILSAMPRDTHPMTMLNAGILCMQNESVFAKEYDEGINKQEYWIPVLEDSIRLIGSLPELAAGIYRMRFNKGPRIEPRAGLDWAASFAHMLGIQDAKGQIAPLMRLFAVLHADHEGGNASAFTSHTVGSTLSDPYYAVSAGLNALAGPLHGLANQETLKFLKAMLEQFKHVPSDEEISKFVWELLQNGRVVPGYGHGVLRCIDPRFTAFHEFGKKVCPEDMLFQLVDRLVRLVPDILVKHGKATSPWPNIDSGTGVLLNHFGLTEELYYTVLFSISRAMGMCAQLVYNRGIGAPLMRPKSVPMNWVRDQIKTAASKPS